MSKRTFTPSDDHQFRLYDGANHDGHARITDIPSFDPHKRTVIILPGTRVNHEMPQYLNSTVFTPSYRRIVQDALAAENVTGANVYCGVYGHNDEQMISDHYSHPNRKDQDLQVRPFTTQAAGTDVRSFVQNALLPMSGVAEHTHPNPAAVAKRLANLSLIPHSYGGTFTAEAAREFQFILRRDHGYSRTDARRIASEVVEAGLAPVCDMQHERLGFRSIHIIGRSDASNLGFMRRVAADHIETGLVPPDTDPESLAQHYHQRSGYTDLPGTQLPPTHAVVENPVASGNSYGQVIRASMPSAIHWKSNSRKDRVMDQAQLDEEHRTLETGVRQLRGLGDDEPITALNGADLIQYGLVPTHDHRMYLQPAGENQELVNITRKVITAAVNRAPQSPNADPAKTVAELAQRAFTPPTVVQQAEYIAGEKDKGIPLG